MVSTNFDKITNDCGDNLLDTGTTSLISTQCLDFDRTKPGEKVKIVGISKDPVVAIRYPMLANSLGYKVGVLVQNLPKHIRRLCPVPPGHKLQDFETGVSGYLLLE